MKKIRFKSSRHYESKTAFTSAKKLVIAFLAMVILVSALPLQGFFASGDDDIVNYPLLDQISSNKPTSGSDWGYGFKDYSTKAAFTVSNADFEAPTAVWDSADLVATIGWNAVTNATKYQLKIFKGAYIEVEELVTATSWVSGLSELDAGIEYQIQVTALDAADAPISASKVTVFTTDEAIATFDYAFTGETSVIYANKSKTSKPKKYYNTELGTDVYYSFNNGTDGRYLAFGSLVTSEANYGTYLTFTAPESGIYDFSAGLSLISATGITSGSIKTRIIKVDSSADETVIWPYNNTNWADTAITDTSVEAAAEIGAPQVELQKDEMIVVQSYFDCDATSGNVDVLISFANPSMVKLSTIESYKPGNRSYSFGSYAPSTLFSGNITKNWKQYSGRWSTEVIRVTGVSVDATYPFTNLAITKQKETLTSRISQKDIGYSRNLSKASLKIEGGLMLGMSGYGVSFNCESPTNGIVMISAAVTGDSADPVKYRLIRNGTQVYPATGVDSWKSITDSEKTAISVSSEAAIGDIFSLQLYSDSAVVKNYDVNVMPSATFYSDDAPNRPTDTVFSPLWERPFKGKTEGSYKFIPIEGNAWQFGILNSPASAVRYTADADTYTTAENFLYDNTETSLTTGYIFDKGQLKFKIGNNDHGMSLTFTAPVSAYYNYSTALTQFGEAENVYFRLLKNGNKVWPKDEEWGTFVDNKGDLPAQETLLSGGETLTLQLYADLREPATVEEGQPPEDVSIEVGLGALAVHRLNHKVESMLSYEPITYGAFEKDYEGEFVNLQGRFNYSFINAEDQVLPLNKTNTATKIISADEKNFITLDGTSPLKLSAAGGNTTVIEYIVNTTSTGEIKLNSAAITAGTQIQITQGEKVLVDWTETLPISQPITITKGDSIKIKLKNSVDYTANFNTFVIFVESTAVSEDITENTSFYAIKSNTSTEAIYTGKYNQPEGSYWFYDLYKSADNTIVGSNYYVGEQIPRLYNEQLDKIGYYFETSNLGADVDAANKNGIALGFKAPKDNTYNFKTGFKLSTENATAKFKLRLVVLRDGETEAEALWPKEGWSEAELSTGESFSVPFSTATLNAGDKLYFQAYPYESNVNRLRLDLASPACAVETAELVGDARQAITSYSPTEALPYAALTGFEGTYIPMKDRWNFMFTNGDKLLDSEHYSKKASTAVLSLNSAVGKPNYALNVLDNSLVTTYSLTPTDNYGAALSVYAPKDGDVMMTYIMTPTAKIAKTAVKFRVVKVSAETGEKTTVWPKNDTEEWEILASGVASKCIKIRDTAAMGDEYIFESMIDMADADRDEYFAANPNKTYISATATGLPVFRMVDIDQENKSYVASNIIQVSNDPPTNNFTDALWTTEYAMNAANPDWQACNWHGNSGYATSKDQYGTIGAAPGNGARMIIWNRVNRLTNHGMPVSVAHKFTAPRDGYIMMANSTASCDFSTKSDDNFAKVRITKNGVKIWPEDEEWYDLDGRNVSFNNLEIQVSKGDEVRFEATHDKVFKEGSRVMYISWNPSFFLNKTANYYNITNDIYSYLSEDMTTHFKGLTAATFAQNDAAGKLMSEQVKARKAAAAAAGPYVPPDPNEGGGEQQITTTTTTITTPGDYTEWTEEIYTPGEKKKVTYTKIIGTNWMPIIIAIICVVSVLLIAAIVLIILHKKGKIVLFKKKKAVE